MTSTIQNQQSDIPFGAGFTGLIVSIFVMLLVLILGLSGHAIWEPIGLLAYASPFFACFAGVLTVRCFGSVSPIQAAKLSTIYVMLSSSWVICFGLMGLIVLIGIYIVGIPQGIVGGVVAAVISTPRSDTKTSQPGTSF
ncbi:MAG: hypothetical protein V3V10_08090 [Planctomycetota bacterium]